MGLDFAMIYLSVFTSYAAEGFYNLLSYQRDSNVLKFNLPDKLLGYDMFSNVSFWDAGMFVISTE